MSDEGAERKQDDRREWLGGPIEHGGGYRPSRTPRRFADAGCCLFEAIGAVSVILALLFFSTLP